MNFNRTSGFGISLFPPAIKGLIIANVVVFIFQYVLLKAFVIDNYTLSQYIFAYGALFPLGEGFGFWQLLTYQFLHGDIMHIFFNLWMLWMFGVELENLWGTKKFIIFYLICGIGAGVTQLFVSPLIAQVGPTVGASGAIFGIFLAYALTFPDRTLMIFPLFIPIKAKYLILIMASLEMILGITSAGGGIAHFAHLGGAATGYLMLLIDSRTGIRDYLTKIFSHNEERIGFGSTGTSNPKGAEIHKMHWTKSSTHSQPGIRSNGFSVDGEQITQARIDEILDRISATGYQNLTEKEKKILFELSQKLK